MDLPPIPKSDTTEAFLKDAPRYSGEILHCQYLLGATDMKPTFTGCPVGNAYTETQA